MVTVSDAELREAFVEPLTAVLGAVRLTLEQTPPDLAVDIEHHGIVLTGGGSLLRGFRRKLSAETGLRVIRAPAPLQSVAVGSGRYLDEPGALGLVLR